MNQTETREKIAALLKEADDLRQPYAGVIGKSMTPDEETKFDKLMADADKLTGDLEKEEKAGKIRSFLKGVPDEVVVVDPSTGKTTEKGQDVIATKAWEKWLLGGRNAVNDQDIDLVAKSSSRALKGQAVGDPIDGGYLVAPMAWVSELIKEMDTIMTMRAISRTFTVTDATSLGAVSLDTDMDDFDWTTELATGEEDDVDFGKRTLTPHPLAKRVKISKTLLRKALMSPEAIVRERATYKLARTQEKAFMTGNGTQRPLGIFTASNDGIGTARDVTSAVSGVIDGDDIIDCQATLAASYQRNASWVLHRLWLAYIRKLKDDSGNYIWTPYDFQGKAIVGLNPGTILGHPYHMSEDAPSTVSAGQYAAVLGDFNYYWIVDALSMSVQVLTELYAETNQNGYIFRAETDAMPVLSSAFVRLKMKA